MPKLKSLSLALVASLVSLSVSTAEAAPSNLQVFYYNQSDPFIANFNQDLLEQAKLNNVNVKSYDATDDAFKQSEQIDLVLSKKNNNDPLLLNLVDTSYAKTIAQNLRESNSAPIIFFNRAVDPQVIKSNATLWYIGADAFSSGTYQTEILIDYLKSHQGSDRNQNGVYDLVLLKGEANHTDAIERTQATFDSLNESGLDYKVDFTANANWDFQKAFDSMDRAISKLTINNIDAVICNNDAMALGAIMALNQYGYNLKDGDAKKFIPVVGIDAIPDALEAIRDGRMLGTVCNDSERMSKIALQIINLNTRDENLVSKTIGLPVKDHQIIVPYLKVQTKAR